MHDFAGIAWKNIGAKLPYTNYGGCGGSGNVRIHSFKWNGTADMFYDIKFHGEPVFFASLYDFKQKNILKRSMRNQDYIAAVVILDNGNVWLTYKVSDDDTKCPEVVPISRDALTKLGYSYVWLCTNPYCSFVVFEFYSAIRMHMIIPVNWLQYELQKTLKAKKTRGKTKTKKNKNQQNKDEENKDEENKDEENKDEENKDEENKNQKNKQKRKK